MKYVSLRIVLIVLAALCVVIVAIVGAYAGWYTYNRHVQIVRAEKCAYDLEHPAPPTMMTAPDGTLAPVYMTEPCITVVVTPPLWDIVRGHIAFEGVPERMKVNPYSLTDILLGRYTLGPGIDLPCDQSATTTDCGEIMRMMGAEPVSAVPPREQQATLYSDVYETIHLLDKQKVDDFLTVHNSLAFMSSEACGVGVRTRGIFIDGTDIVARIAMLATEAGAKSLWGADVFCEALQRKRGGVIEVRDPLMFSGSDVGLRGRAYNILIATHQFVVAPEENRIYPSSAYDGSRGEPIGTLWQEHTQAETGISFSCPMLGQVGSGPGETGRGLYFSCNTSDGFINGGAITVDYSVPKGGTMYPREGYVERDGSYYLLRRGVPAETPFVPDEIWVTADGRDVLVKFAKREGYDFHADYPEPAIMGVMNIERGGFSGIGFGWHTDVFRFASPEDIALVKRILSTVQFFE